MSLIKMQDVMKICEKYSSHCFFANNSRGQEIADKILDEVVELPTVDTVNKKKINETLKCLESCIGRVECKDCPKKEVLVDCVGELLKDSFELIKEMKEEREALYSNLRSDNMKEGWICPRCKKVNSPYVTSCDCSLNNFQKTNTNYTNFTTPKEEYPFENLVHEVDCINGYHKWIFRETAPSDCYDIYECKYCGKSGKIKKTPN